MKDCVVDKNYLMVAELIIYFREKNIKCAKDSRQKFQLNFWNKKPLTVLCIIAVRCQFLSMLTRRIKFNAVNWCIQWHSWNLIGCIDKKREKKGINELLTEHMCANLITHLSIEVKKQFNTQWKWQTTFARPACEEIIFDLF